MGLTVLHSDAKVMQASAPNFEPSLIRIRPAASPGAGSSKVKKLNTTLTGLSFRNAECPRISIMLTDVGGSKPVGNQDGYICIQKLTC